MLESYLPKPPAFLVQRLYIGDEIQFDGVDFIVIDAESAVFIEATVSAVPMLKVLSADWFAQKKSLDEILFSTKKGSLGKAYKIAEAIRKFKSGQQKIPGINPKLIKKIYPVLLLERGFPQIPPIIGELRAEIFEKTQMTEANYFEIWDVEEFEGCQTVFKSSISEFIERMRILIKSAAFLFQFGHHSAEFGHVKNLAVLG
jgi:hypothetical protein